MCWSSCNRIWSVSVVALLLAPLAGGGFDLVSVDALAGTSGEPSTTSAQRSLSPPVRESAESEAAAAVRQPAPTAGARACPDLEQAVLDSNTLGGRLDALLALRQHCTASHFDRVLSDTISAAMGEVASDRLDGGQKTRLLRRVVQLDKLNWKAFSQLAAIDFDAEHWAGAVDNATAALRTMPSSVADPELIRIAEDLADVRDIARGLSADYLAPPSATRGGEFRAKHRGELITIVLQEPIEFEDNSVVLTAKGQSALAQLQQNLRAEFSASKPRVVSILGHTDERGLASYNCDLSRRRAEAVRAELASAGMLEGVEVHVVAQGEQNPRRSERADRLSIEQRQQLDRRVQWVSRKPSRRERLMCDQPRERES